MRIFSVKKAYPAIAYGTFSYFMLLSDQRRCNVNGIFKSFFNSLRAARICNFLSYPLYFLIFQFFFVSTIIIQISPHIQKKLAIFTNLKNPKYKSWMLKMGSLLIYQIHNRVARRILFLSEINRGIYLKAGQYIGNLERIMPKF